MRDATRRQMTWFILKLLNLRMKIDGFSSPIQFTTNLIKSPLFNLEQCSQRDHVLNMLREIKEDEDFLVKVKRDGKELTWEEADGFIIIKKFGTEFLLSYFKERLHNEKSIFGFSTNTRRAQILTIFGEKTNITISGNQYLVLAHLLRNFSRKVAPFSSHHELYAELKKNKSHGADYWASREEYSLQIVDDTINNLRRTLKDAAKGFLHKETKFIENKRGGNYKLIL